MAVNSLTPDSAIQLQPDTAPAQPETPIQLPPMEQPSYMLTPDLVKNRAFRVAYSVSGTSADQPLPNIEDKIQTGQEQDLRQSASDAFNNEYLNKRYSLFSKALANKDGPLTPEDIQGLNTATWYNFPYPYPVDPKSVFEQAYGVQYISEADKRAQSIDDTHPWTVANQASPTDMDAVRKFGSVTVAQSQYLLSKADEVQAKANDQSYVGYGLDFLKLAFPILNPYYEIKMRGNVGDTGFLEGGLLGGNIEAQRQKLFQMPFEQFTQTVDKIVGKMSQDNPQLAMMFITSMLQYASSDKFMDNINTIGNLADLGGIVKIGGIAFNRTALANSVKNTAKDFIKASVDPKPTPENISAAVGDLGGSAQIKATTNVVNDIKGSANPEARAIDDLPSYMKTLLKDIELSDLSTTQKNILEEQTKGTFERFLKTIQDTPTPNPVPIETMTAEQLAELSKTIPQRYGIQNDLIHISDPTPNQFSRGYDVTMWLGKDGGKYFDTAEEAMNAAKLRGFKVSYSQDAIANVQARIKDLEDTLKIPLDMHDDVHAMNLRDSQEKQLASLQKELADAKATKGGFEVKNSGLGHYVEITASLDQTHKYIRDLQVTPERPASLSPESWTENIPYLNHLRTAEDIFSPEQRANRKLANYPQSRFFKMVLEDGKYLSDVMRGIQRVDPVTGEKLPFYKNIPGARSILRKEEWNRLKDALDYSQSAKHPDLPDSKEGYYMTPSELEHYYITKYDERPSFAEVQAYEAVKRWSEMDLMFRKISEHRNMARLGTETQEILVKDAAGAEVRSPKFEGIRIQEFPNSRGTVMIMGDNPNEAKLISAEKYNAKQRDKITEEIAAGRLMGVKLYRPRQFPLKGFAKDGDSLVHYVLAPRIESSPLGWDLIPRQGGGHTVYDHPLYVKQANMKLEIVSGVRKANYLGDTTLAPVSYTPLGQDLVTKLNSVKNLIRDAKLTDAKQAYKNFGLEGAFGPWKDFKAMFAKVKNPDGTFSPPRFNITEDFELVPKNLSTVDVSKTLAKKYGEKGEGAWRNSWRDATREGSPADQFQVEFTGQRDAAGLYSVENIGSQAKPIYRQIPAKKIDPTEVLQRGMRRIIHSSFMDDYKQSAVENWIAQAKKYINEHDSYIDRSPFYYFKNANRKMFIPGTPQREINKLMAQHFQIEQFVGTPTVLDSFVYSTYQKIADTVYGIPKIGPRAANYVTPAWLIPKLKDPFAFMRSITFHAYLGLGAIPQVLVQMMTYVNMFAVAPTHAPVGSMGAFFHLLSRLNRNPEILDHLDSLAAKFRLPGMPRYRPGEWKEAMETLDRSGFANVGQEYALLGDMTRNKLFKRGKERFLDIGTTPFKMGETSTRIGAWYIAMKEFRTKNPTGRITNSDVAKILDRADFLYGNMSNASHSALNSGVFSVPFQFYNYSTRLAEMFWSGTRLGGTLTERNLARARLIFMNALMFGAPLGIGVTGLPLTDTIRQKALDTGLPGTSGPYVVGQNGLETQIMEGAMATLLHQMTGKYYATGPRYGLQGLDRIKDLMWKDQKFWQVAGGASASLLSNWYGDQSDLFKAMGRIAHGDFQSFPIQLEDLVNIFKEAYVVNKGQAMWIAMNTGRWVDKNYQTVEKTSWQNAAFMFLTGLTSTEQRDLWTKGLTLKDRNDLEKTAIKQATENLNRSIIAQQSGNTEQARDYQRRAMAWICGADLSPSKACKIPANVFQQIGSDKIDSTNFKFYFQDAPLSQSKPLGSAFEWIQKNKGK